MSGNIGTRGFIVGKAWAFVAVLAMLLGCMAEGKPTAGAEPAKAPVRFLMQNVQNYFVAGEKQRSNYIIHPKKEEECNAVAETIASAKPDVVGLVEIGGPRALDDLADRLAKRGLDYPHRMALTRNGEERALAILSKFPIVKDNSKADYGLYGSHKRQMLRGILDVTVKTDDGCKFRILGAHLKAHKGDSEEAAAALRKQEAETLAHYVQETMKKDSRTPLLVYGDWNDEPDADTVSILEKGLSPKSALRLLKPVDSQGAGWTHFYAFGNEHLTYDRIYVNAALFSRIKKAKSGVVDTPTAVRGSDHRAVWCELR